MTRVIVSAKARDDFRGVIAYLSRYAGEAGESVEILRILHGERKITRRELRR